MSEQDVEALFPLDDAAGNGYFVGDPTSKDFLLSPRAGRVFLSMLLGWMKNQDNEQCRREIDSYAEGGDGGLTGKNDPQGVRLCVHGGGGNLPRRSHGPTEFNRRRKELAFVHSTGVPQALTRPLVRVESLADRSVPGCLRRRDEGNLSRLRLLVLHLLKERMDLVTCSCVSRTKGIWSDPEGFAEAGKV